MEHSKFIIITSIFQPTEAVQVFAQMSDFQLVVVGDKKTPKDWNCPNVIFLPVDDNSLLKETKLQLALPYNHYCRKMLGYLYAIQQNAKIIIDTDDDNVPKTDWHFPGFDGIFLLFNNDQKFVNIYNYFTEQHIWARGLPLNAINRKNDFSTAKPEFTKVGIWQGLADEDPDVDAIYRLVSEKPCVFNEKPPIVLDNGAVSPFNTQNTCIRRELFPLLYLPVYVSFRFTDILRGLVAQPIMWLYDFHLGFTSATVVQKRNPHDYFKDFLLEIPMYEHCEKVVELVEKVVTVNRSISDNLYEAYCELSRHNIVTVNELSVLETWLEDIIK